MIVHMEDLISFYIHHSRYMHPLIQLSRLVCSSIHPYSSNHQPTVLTSIHPSLHPSLLFHDSLYWSSHCRLYLSTPLHPCIDHLNLCFYSFIHPYINFHNALHQSFHPSIHPSSTIAWSYKHPLHVKFCISVHVQWGAAKEMCVRLWDSERWELQSLTKSKVALVSTLCKLQTATNQTKDFPFALYCLCIILSGGHGQNN